MGKVIIVLAGNYEQYKRYIWEQFGDNEEERNCRVYAEYPDRIRGLRAEKVEVIGTFWERHDASKLKGVADSRVR